MHGRRGGDRDDETRDRAEGLTAGRMPSIRGPLGAIGGAVVLAATMRVACVAAPAPAATATPLPLCPNVITVKLRQSFGQASFQTYACDLGQLGPAPFATPASRPFPITGSATLRFSGPKVQVEYALTQDCILANNGILFNDNVIVQLRWWDLKVKGVALAERHVDPPLSGPLKQKCGVPPSPPPSPVPGPPSATPTPTPRQYLGEFLVAYGDVNQICGATIDGIALDPSTCSAKVTQKWSNRDGVWAGNIALSIATLQARGVPKQFALSVLRNVRAGIDTFRDFSLSRTRAVEVVIEPVIAAQDQQYTALAGDIGAPSDIPPHRLNGNLFLPAGIGSLAAASFADDAGQQLAIRNGSIGKLKISNAKSFTCRSCGSFRSGATQPFEAPFSSTTALGLDLGTLGVDAVPFSLDSASYPIDSGEKLIVDGPTRIAIGTLAGTTSNGVAHDTTFELTRAINGRASGWQIGLFHANANRSNLAPPKPGPFPAVTPALAHSANSQASIAYSFSPEALHVLETVGVQERPALTYSTLIRYGTQYGPGSQVIDVAESIQRTPPALDPLSAASERWHFSGAFGYRRVGAQYAPLDGTFDAHAGQHGMYGQLQYTQPVHTSLTANYSVAAFSFSDQTHLRDEQVVLKVTYPVSRLFSLQTNDTVGQLAISQVGRANNILIGDSIGGADLLPNGQTNLQLAYTPGPAFQLTGGYTRLATQSCNVKLVVKPHPCFAYRSPTAVGDVAWMPFPNWPALADVFVEASLQGSTTTPFETATDAVLRTPQVNYYDTTQSHVVRTAALGMHIFKHMNACSTLLLTSANRGGDIDQFAKGAPVPGFTNTASLEIVPNAGLPALLVAYSRVSNKNQPAEQRQFLVRLQFGVPFRSYSSALTSSC